MRTWLFNEMYNQDCFGVFLTNCYEGEVGKFNQKIHVSKVCPNSLNYELGQTLMNHHISQEMRLTRTRYFVTSHVTTPKNSHT